MSVGKVPEELKYTKSHEWVRLEGSEAVIGITDHAQSELTDIVFVDLPAVGKRVEAGAGVLTLESVKTVADVYAPFTGTVGAVNTDLKNHPDLVNKDPYGAGWLYRLRVEGTPDPSHLLDAAAYRAEAEKAGSH